MINSLENFADCGRKAAKARQDRDEARARFERDFFLRMRQTEKIEDRRIADEAYETAYRTQSRGF